MESRLRVAINAVGAIRGGAVRHLPPFMAELRAMRPEWSVHLWVNPQASIEPADRLHVTIVPRQSIPARFVWENRQFVRELHEAHIDIAVSLSNSCPLVGPVPYVMYERNTLWFDPAWLKHLSQRWRAEAAARRWLTFLQGRKATTVVVPSQAMKDLLRLWRGWPRSAEIVVIPHAVDVDQFPYVAHEWPPPERRPLRLLSVGHEFPHKDHLLMIELVRLLRDEGREAQLTLTIDPARDDDYVRRLVSAVRRHELQKQVHFAGEVRDVAALYAASDVVLSASITESFGFPLLEAMSSGVPLLVASIAASREAAADVAWFFEPGNVFDARVRLVALLATPAAEMRRHLDDGRRRAASYTWRRNVASVIEVIERTYRDRVA